MRPEALLILPPWYPAREGGYAGIFVRAQARALALSRDVIVLHVALKSPLDAIRDPRLFAPRLSILTEGKLREIRLSILNPFPGLLPLRKLWLESLYRILMALLVLPRNRITAIHAHSIQDQGLFAARIANRDRPFFVTEHSSRYLQERAFAPLARYRMRRCALQAKAVIAVSPSLRDRMAEKLGLERERIAVVPNIVDTDFFYLRERRFDQSAPRLVAVCNLVPLKALDKLIDAMKTLMQDCPGISLRIAGQGELRGALEEQAILAGLSDRVRFEGSLAAAELRTLLWNSDILVLPSTMETFGVVLIEALSTGMPVVATRCGGPEGIVGPSDGELVEAGSASAIAEGIRRLVARYTSLEPQEMRTRCVSRYGTSAIVSQLEALYNPALSCDSGYTSCQEET